MRFYVRTIDMNTIKHGYSYNDWLEICLNKTVPTGAKLISLEKINSECYRIVYEVRW